MQVAYNVTIELNCITYPGAKARVLLTLDLCNYWVKIKNPVAQLHALSVLNPDSLQSFAKDGLLRTLALQPDFMRAAFCTWLKRSGRDPFLIQLYEHTQTPKVQKVESVPFGQGVHTK